MLAVALIAISLGIFLMVERRQTYLRKAEGIRRMEIQCRAVARGDADAIERVKYSDSVDPEWNARCADYYARMRIRYEQGASTPWLIVERDPPPK